MSAFRLRQRLFASGTMVAVALLVLACGPAQRGPSAAAPAGADAPAAPAPAPPPEPLKLRSAYTTIAANVAPIWMAQEGGYFREQGLEVELIHTDAGAPLLAALSNRELDIVSAGGTSLVLGYLQGMDIQIIGSTANKIDTIVFVRPEIQTIDDLRGKTIGVTNLKAITDTAVRLAAKRVGLQPDVDIFTRRTGGLAESLAAIETGVLDGASLSVPVIFEARRRGYREMFNVAQMDVAYLTSGIGSTKRVLNERPELAVPFLRAIAQGVARLKTDRDFAIQVLSQYTRLEDLDLVGATVDHARPLWPSDPYPEPHAIQTVLDEEDHPAARTTRPEDVADFRFAAALRASGFLDTLPR